MKVARFAQGELEDRGHTAALLDLRDYGFPIMEERLHKRDDPPPGTPAFSRAVSDADAVVVVSPEYNGGIPGVLKNALDYLYKEWARKPVGIISVSGGGFGGIEVKNQLQLLFLRLRAVPVAHMAVSHVHEAFGDDGTPADPAYRSNFDRFHEILLWYAQALSAAQRG